METKAPRMEGPVPRPEAVDSLATGRAVITKAAMQFRITGARGSPDTLAHSLEAVKITDRLHDGTVEAVEFRASNA
jgi:hypothetical protein